MNNTKWAAIAAKNNRLKIYKSDPNIDTVYLKDEDEFQIELFNPKSTSVLAKIWINNKLISESGLVIRPGQRFFLERFIDSNNKFVFRTYDVNLENSEVLKAIENNGDVKVIFYPEKITADSKLWVNPLNRRISLDTSSPNWNGMYFSGTTPSFGGSTTGNAYYNSTTTIAGSANTTFTSTSSGAVGSNGPSGPSGIQANYETGRVEMGGSSSQNFGTVQMDFENNPCCITNIKILAESNKPLDITEIRNYCSDCGTRIKKQTWKFCPDCGTKID
jgi:hypothetical protein